MTTADLVARYLQLVAYDLDSILGPLPDPTDASASAAYSALVVGALNEAMFELADAANLYDPGVVLTPTVGKGRYNLDDPAFSARIVEPYSAAYQGYPLRNAVGNDASLWTLGELQRYRPTWATDATGTPQRAVFLGDSILLHPAPSSTTPVVFDARVAPAPMSLASPAVPCGLPLRMHPGVAQKAVYATCTPFAQGQAQTVRLQAMLSEATAIAEAVGRANAAARLGNGSTAHALRQEMISI